jgi:hypothetical protein
LSAIFLRGVVSRREVLPLVVEHLHESTPRDTKPRPEVLDRQEQSATAIDTAEATLQTSLDTCPKSLEDPALLSRFAQQDVDIKKLSGNLELLQERMLALENLMIGGRTGSGSSSMDGMKRGQDMIIDTSETILRGALEDARSVAMTMEDLRLENEQLKQKLQSIAARVASELDDVSSRDTLDKVARLPSAAPPLPAKTKKPYTRRKPLTSRKSIAMAASGLVAPVTRFASADDQLDSSQIGSLEALREITTAMAQAPSAKQTRISNDSLHHGFGIHCDQEPEDGSPDAAGLILGNGDDTKRSQPNKRRRTGGGELAGAGNAMTSAYGKIEAADVTDLASMSSHLEAPQLSPGFAILQGTGPRPSIVTQLQDAASAFQIASTDDETMIDPALRSTCVPADQTLAKPGVLSSIENLPDQPQSRQSSQQRSNNGGTPLYDSDQERRIREYKARDALRKRKARAASTGKKKMDGEEKFKQDEKIRARDRMVKELMEREEMLENDGDL